MSRTGGKKVYGSKARLRVVVPADEAITLRTLLAGGSRGSEGEVMPAVIRVVERRIAHLALNSPGAAKCRYSEG